MVPFLSRVVGACGVDVTVVEAIDSLTWSLLQQKWSVHECTYKVDNDSNEHAKFGRVSSVYERRNRRTCVRNEILCKQEEGIKGTRIFTSCVVMGPEKKFRFTGN